MPADATPEPGPASAGTAHVFLSYASADRERALRVASALDAAGVPVWVDRRGISAGSEWAGEIAVAIRGCVAVIVLCSAQSLVSRNVRRELQLAWDRDKPILPVLLDRTEFPDAVAYFLQGRQWVEILDRPEAVWLLELVEAIGRFGDGEGHGLVAARAPASSAPPATSVPLAGVLPMPPTRLIGREGELADLITLLRRDDARLVTLVGPGGVGKTRLALAAAASVMDAGYFADGARFVDLAPVSDPSLVPSVIAQALGVREGANRSPFDLLAAALREKQLLLVVDNWEQVIEAAPIAGELLATSPGLTVLATSREPLRLRSEHEISVAPLPLPAPVGSPSLAELAQVAAVQLFVERATSAHAGFALTAENAAAIAEIVRRLDGLPLAIELAAARVKMLPPRSLLGRLEHRLPVLTGGARDAPARQRTLRDAIAWSHDLLGEAERILFRRLAVFAGGWTLDAAERVMGGDPPASSVFDDLASLVDKSLVRQEDHTATDGDPEPRFRMLETVREFGLGQLAASGDEPEIRRRHAAWCLDLAEQANRVLMRLSGEDDWLWRLEAERDNMRGALAWAEQTGDWEMGHRLGGALAMFWYQRGAFREGRRWLDIALGNATEVSTSARAWALWGNGLLALYQCDSDVAVQAFMSALASFRPLGDELGEASSLLMLGIVAEDTAEYDRAADLLAEARAITRKPAVWPIDATPRSHVDAIVCYHQGIVAWGRGDLVAATVLLEDAHRSANAGGGTFVVAYALTILGLVAYDQGNVVHAAALLSESLTKLRIAGDQFSSLSALAGVAAVTASCNHAAIAARFFGAVGAQEALIGTPLKHPERAVFDRATDAARAALGDAEFTAAWDAGWRLSLDDAVAEALAWAGELAADR